MLHSSQYFCYVWYRNANILVVNWFRIRYLRMTEFGKNRKFPQKIVGNNLHERNLTKLQSCESR